MRLIKLLFTNMVRVVNEDVKNIVGEVDFSELEGKTIFISGAAGFLGSYFIAAFQYLNKHIFKKPCKILAIDNYITSTKKNLLVKISDKNIVFQKMDIAKGIGKFENEKIDYIIHAAGLASPIYYRKYPIESINCTVLGLHHLLLYATKRKIKSFLFFSSSEIYGNPRDDEVPTKETYNGNVSCIGPRSCYDEAKRLGETMCLSYYKTYKIPVKWVRPFNVYGPGMRINDDRVVPKFLFQALAKKPLTIHIPGLQTRTFTYVSDAMIGFLKVLLNGRDGEVYNIGRDTGEIRMEDLADKVNELFRKKIEIRKIEMPQEYPSDQAQRRLPDITKAREHLSFDPKISIDDGLKRMLSWCKVQV